MQAKVENYIKEHKMLRPGSRVVAAVSGGADSVCLLHLLTLFEKKLDLQLKVVHVHHGLRGKEADRDAQFVRELSEAWKVPCLVVFRNAADYAKKMEMSVEEAGRELRYQAFGKAAEEMGDGLIAVAHHQDDQAETILHNLFRGSAIKGLGGMSPVRGSVIRPLLCVSRQEILEYLEKQKIPYCVDSTNFSVDYTRNRLRHKVLPMISKEINAGAVRHIAEAGERLRQAEEYLNKEAERLWKEHRQIQKVSRQQNVQPESFEERRGIRGKIIMELPDILQGYIVMEMIGEVTGLRRDITSRHVAEVLDIARKGTGRSSSLPYGIRVYKEYDMVWMERLTIADLSASKQSFLNEKNEEVCQLSPLPVLSPSVEPDSLFDLSSPLLPPPFTAECFPAVVLREKYHKIPENKYTKWFDYDKIKGTLSVRTRKTGDYFTLKDGKRKTIKAFMIDEKIPRAERDKILLVAEGQHILWIVGYRISEFYKITEETKQILQVKMDGGEEHGG